MKNYLVFGIVTIFSFLGCVYFLSVPELYKSAATLMYQSKGSPITPLSSSISFAASVTTSEATNIIQEMTLSQPYAANASDSIALFKRETMHSAPITYSNSSPETVRAANTRSLLKAPVVKIATMPDEIDSSVAMEAVPSPEISTNTRAVSAIISHKQEAGSEYTSNTVLTAYINALTGFARQYNYSEDLAFFINLGMKSGKKRFYVVNLRSGQVITRGLVAHGQGKRSFTLNKQYSNKLGSGCSSLGIYKVGGSYFGGYGKSFRLTGLEKSNSNAFRRAIVLHAMNCIPDEELNYPICQSEGCPSLSPNFLQTLTPMIKSSKKPILLWVFDPSKESNTSLH